MIGDRSTGTWWAATDEVLLHPVAIKQVKCPRPAPPPPQVSLHQQRLLREARAIAVLSNPNVITVYVVLPLLGGPVILMELLRPSSWPQITSAHGRLSPRSS